MTRSRLKWKKSYRNLHSSPILRNLLTDSKNYCTMRSFFTLALSLAAPAILLAQPDSAVLKSSAITDIQSKYSDYKAIALQIWNYAEVGYKK